MVEYVMTYGRPRLGPIAGTVIYERRILRKELGMDRLAVQWGLEAMPYEMGLELEGKRYLAAPIRIERAASWGEAVLWEISATEAHVAVTTPRDR